MRHCLSSPGLEWSISKSQWKPFQGCARGSGLASILALGLVRGDPQIYRTARLEKLWHLACVFYSQTIFYPREGRLKGDPPGPRISSEPGWRTASCMLSCYL